MYNWKPPKNLKKRAADTNNSDHFSKWGMKMDQLFDLSIAKDMTENTTLVKKNKSLFFLKIDKSEINKGYKSIIAKHKRMKSEPQRNLDNLLEMGWQNNEYEKLGEYRIHKNDTPAYSKFKNNKILTLDKVKCSKSFGGILNPKENPLLITNKKGRFKMSNNFAQKNGYFFNVSNDKLKTIEASHSEFPNLSKLSNKSIIDFNTSNEYDYASKFSKINSQPYLTTKTVHNSSSFYNYKDKNTGTIAMPDLKQFINYGKNVNNNMIYPSICNTS